MKKFNPRCVADMKDPKCHFYVRLYVKTELIDIETIENDCVLINKGFKSEFINEVEARFIEWGYGEYRISFPFDGPGSQTSYFSDEKRLDIRYGDKATYKEYGDKYIFVLNIKSEKGLKSVCK